MSNSTTSQNQKQISVCLDAAQSLGGVVRFSVDENTGEVYPARPAAAVAAISGGAAAGCLVLNTVFASGIEKQPDLGRGERVIRRYQLQAISRRLLPKERVAKCMMIGFGSTGGVDVMYSEAVNRAHYKNLITCGRPWICPVCAAKISERRRVELAQGVATWRARGGSVFMVTYTMQHCRKDKLDALLLYMSTAYRAIKSGRRWQEFEMQYGIVGNVSATEITFGRAAGFHPHKHALYFSDRILTELDATLIGWELSQRWKNCLDQLGRTVNSLVGVKVQLGFGAVADYVAKWGVVEEITKAPTKSGRLDAAAEHYSPFQLLELVGQGVAWADPAFLEYAGATKGLRQLRWSPGLRDLLNLGADLTDEEVAAAEIEKAKKLLTLCWPAWQQVARRELRGQLLEVASCGRADLVYVWLAAFGIEVLRE